VSTAVRDTLDVSALPSYGFGSRSLMWWGTLGVIAIEGTAFVLTAFAYLYLRTRVEVWPPGVPPPSALWGTLNTAVLLASLLPNEWTRRAAERHDLRKVRLGLVVALGFAVVFLVLRVFEFAALGVRWDTNAYGSVVWMLLGLHTVHLLTDALDTLVLAVLMFTGPIEGKRFVDVAENSFYWYFVVFAWLPIYALIYGASRIL
jgi:cytochrome c oxidase subunit III